jgi:hypothetical protein
MLHEIKFIFKNFEFIGVGTVLDTATGISLTNVYRCLSRRLIEMDPDEQLKNKLKEIWAKSQDWDDTPTSEEGIYLVRYPLSGMNQTYIGIKFKRSPNARKGIFVKNSREISVFRELLNNSETRRFFDQISADRALQKKFEGMVDWDQVPTTVSGIWYTKMPEDNNSSWIIGLAIKPVN